MVETRIGIRTIRLATLALALGACGSATEETDDAVDGVAETADEATVDVPQEDAPPADGIEDEATADEAAGEDATIEDAEADAPEEDVVETVEDDGSTEEADAPPVEGGCDPAHETPSPGGMCDGRGIMACQEWAHTNGGLGAVAVCISAGSGSCARATECADTSDPATCRCGLLPACVRGEVCVTFPDATPACVCATGM